MFARHMIELMKTVVYLTCQNEVFCTLCDFRVPIIRV